jgi:hypothetical protein
LNQEQAMVEATKKAQGSTHSVTEPVARRPAKTATPSSKPETVAPSAGKQSAAPAGNAVPPVCAKPVRRSSPVDETVDKHRKVLAEALEQAQAIRYDSPQHLKPAKAEKPAKIGKPDKERKTKRVRISFAMPEAEYVQIGELKKRLHGAFKKSELLRAGIAVLSALNDTELPTVMGHIQRIKTGRPTKK